VFLSVHDQVANLFTSSASPILTPSRLTSPRYARASLCDLTRDLQDRRDGLTFLSEKSAFFGSAFAQVDGVDDARTGIWLKGEPCQDGCR
jgi:hypothetical protein